MMSVLVSSGDREGFVYEKDNSGAAEKNQVLSEFAQLHKLQK